MTRYKTLLSGFAACMLASTGAVAQVVGFATLPAGAINNIQAQVIAKAVQDASDLKIRVTPYRGGGAVAAAVNGERAEFGISDATEATDALIGRGSEYQGRTMPKLRVAFRVLAFSVSFWVRKDSDIKTMADIKGRKFSSEWSAFPNAIPLANGLFATAGFSLADIDGVPASNIITAAEDFKAGKTEVLFFAVGGPKVAEVNSSVGGIRAISAPNTPEALARMKKVRPDYFIMTVKPAPPYAGILEPTNVLGSDLTIYTNSTVSDDTVYKFVKAAHGQKAAMAKGHPSFNGFEPENMGKQFSEIKYHPGAIKFYKEIGIWKGN